jgi:hypothetical protein
MNIGFRLRSSTVLAVVTFALAAVGPLRPACGMDFSLSQVSPWGFPAGADVFVLMKGEIIPGDYAHLLQFSVNNNVNLARGIFILSSPGGDVSEALKIGHLVKSLYATVSVGPVTGQCVSACFIIFASAVHRLMNNEMMIGIHRPYVYPDRLRSLSPSAAEALETDALLDAEKYLHALRVPTSLVEEMFEQASTEVHWLTKREYLELGQRPPWYEEFLIARCGFDKNAETRFLNNRASIQDRMSLQAAADCEESLTRPEALKNFDCSVRQQLHGGSQCK